MQISIGPTARRHGATKDLRATQCETVAELTAPATHRGGAAWPAPMEIEMLGPRGSYENVQKYDGDIYIYI